MADDAGGGSGGDFVHVGPPPSWGKNTPLCVNNGRSDTLILTTFGYISVATRPAQRTHTQQNHVRFFNAAILPVNFFFRLSATATSVAATTAVEPVAAAAAARVAPLVAL